MASFLSSYFTGSSEQIERLSNIFDNAGQVALGALVFSQLVNGFDSSKLLVIISGVMTVVVSWMTSLWLAKKGKEHNAI